MCVYVYVDVYVDVYVYVFVFVCVCVYVYDLPQWFHVCATSLIYIYIILKINHESSRTPQHSNWNSVGTHRPQHMHMYSPHGV